MGIDTGTFYSLAAAALYVIALGFALSLIYDERDPSTTLAWMLILFAIPGLGVVLYFLLGRNWRQIGRRNRRRLRAFERGHQLIRPVYQLYGPAASDWIVSDPLSARISRAIQTQNGTRPLPCVGLEIMREGAEKFSNLMRDIERAEKFIHLEYFIWENDELTGRFCEVLADKVAAGVEVRVLYDWVGSLPYGKSQLRALRAAGALVHADAAQWYKLNYRNHRKIAVIDGAVAYTGGMNMGAEYVDGGSRFDTWRDTHLRFGGPLVLEMQRLFCQRWYEVAGEDLFSARYFPEAGDEALVAGGVWSQVAVSGPESRWEAIRQAFMLVISSAQTQVRVQSPYFVPDQGIMDALVGQALAAVDVRFMMTGKPDKRIAWWAGQSYLYALTSAGGRAYQYMAGFFHCKALTVDGRIAALGTANFDIRSFMLHDELMIFFFDEEIARAQDAIFDDDMERCAVVTADDLHDQGRLVRFRNALVRLASRVL